ncbi:MAG TPA: peptidylprolyl isomerase [Flavobacteriales bacterium]|nr:peptidylprolyl isomerase [Flavobacteriales bacterium]
MKKYIALFFLLVINQALAQKQSEVLMTINDKPVSTAEFEKMYTQNLDLVQDPAQKDIDNYKKLFLNYRLELEDAYQLKYDTFPQLQRELKSYRNDLAKKYLSDNDIVDKLVKEAYQRMQSDVRVAHILVQVPSDASPKDTLKAYNEIVKIYKEAKKGADFSQLAQKYSQDPSAKANKGDLGYINVFHTVYPFETAAYNTPVGQVSKPFRTRFGYHIIKVLDKRPAKGEIEVAHIVALNKKDGQDQSAEAKKRIENIYEKLKNKEDTFENLARKFSDDKRSARSGGRLRKFGIRSMIPEFETAAFSLKKEGDISQPFETKYGWHIVKLLKKYPMPDFNQIERQLRQKVLRDERSKMGKEKLMKRIEKEFPVKMVGNMNKVYKAVTKDFFNNKWQIPQNKDVNETLFTINNDQKVTYKDFYSYLYKRQSHNGSNLAKKKQIIDKYFERFKKDQLYDYYNRHLEDIYPDFAATMQEYKHGLMLFNIKSDKVWDKSIKDTLGLQKFFEQHKNQYKWPVRYEVLMIQTNDQKTAKKIAKLIKKGKSIKNIKAKFKSNSILIKKQEYTAEDPFIKKHQLTKNKPQIYKEGNQYIVLNLTQIKPAAVPSLKEVKGKVTSDYQNYLEKQWLEELKQKYPVKINEKAWEKIYAKYKD